MVVEMRLLKIRPPPPKGFTQSVRKASPKTSLANEQPKRCRAAPGDADCPQNKKTYRPDRDMGQFDPTRGQAGGSMREMR
jgi:hypothetical protein